MTVDTGSQSVVRNYRRTADRGIISRSGRGISRALSASVIMLILIGVLASASSDRGISRAALTNHPIYSAAPALTPEVTHDSVDRNELVLVVHQYSGSESRWLVYTSSASSRP
jgi:hypothetical protein